MESFQFVDGRVALELVSRLYRYARPRRIESAKIGDWSISTSVAQGVLVQIGLRVLFALSETRDYPSVYAGLRSGQPRQNHLENLFAPEPVRIEHGTG